MSRPPRFGDYKVQGHSGVRRLNIADAKNVANLEPPAYRPVTRSIFGLRFSKLNTLQIVQQVTQPAPPPGLQLLVTCNIDHLFNLRRSPRFEEAYANAAIITVDGAPIAAYLRLRGIRDIQRVTGADLLPEIMDRLAPGAHRPFFVCAAAETGERLSQLLRERGFSDRDIMFDVPPFGFEHDADYSNALAQSIADHRATHIVFGLGSPKSEIWLSDHASQLPPAYALCFGAGLDFVAGRKRRAPLWMRKSGLEWFWRLLGEPRRLIGRYSRDAANFLVVIVEDLRKVR